MTEKKSGIETTFHPCPFCEEQMKVPDKSANSNQKYAGIFAVCPDCHQVVVCKKSGLAKPEGDELFFVANSEEIDHAIYHSHLTAREKTERTNAKDETGGLHRLRKKLGWPNSSERGADTK
jgi:hypothetical protein